MEELEKTTTPSSSSAELCSICFNSFEVVAVGKCNHAHTCAVCTLRLRLYYRDRSCPFCKTQLKRVYLTERKNGTKLDYASLAARRTDFETETRWQCGIWVDTNATCEGVALFEYLRRRLRRSCRLCHPDGDATEEFASFKEMRDHLRRAHDGAVVCNVCYQANRYFPRELEIFEGEGSLGNHLKMHPRCDYCKTRFFGKDELFQHMQKKHCLCQLCQSQGQRHVYFENTQHYSQHLREQHYACTESGCADSLIAFAAAEELNRHLSDVHGMGTSNRRGMRPVHPQLLAQPHPPLRATPRRRGFAGNDLRQRGEEGFRMIDDDLPPVYGAPPPPTRPQGRAAPAMLPLSRDFPALPATSAPLQPALNIPRKIPGKRVCACGRISQSLRIVEGTSPEKLPCDAECERAQHRARLAEAFNIDTQTYTGSFEAQYSTELVGWARDRGARVDQFERKLQERIRLRDVQRFTLEGVQREEKKLLVALAESYGAVGRIVRDANAVEVVLTNRSALPAKRLTHYAKSLTQDAYLELLRESLKYTLYLEDIAKSVNPRRYLVSWDGDYEIEYVSKTMAKLKFRTPQAFKSARDGLGGGIRDAFKVRRPLKDLQPTCRDAVPAERGPERGRTQGRRPEVVEERSVALTLANSYEVLSRL